ncbi:MAG TPA: PAS domain S-box protein [Verrucomicrobiae bacterium]
MALIYGFVGGFWIILSDLLVNHFTETRFGDDVGDMGKGLLFVFITAFVLWRLLLKELVRREEITQEALLYQHLTESSHDAIFMLDPENQFRIVYANEAAVKHFGHPREHLMTLLVHEWSPTSTLELAAKMWTRIQNEGHIGFDSTHVLADKRIVPVEVSANKVVFCGKEYLAGSWRNISERKQAEAALRESHQRYELALQGAGLGAWDWNIQTGKLILNRRWAEMLGYKLEELDLTLEAWRNLIHPEDLPASQKAWADHLTGLTEHYTAKMRMKTKAGGWLWVMNTGRVFERDAAGKPLRALGTHQDIDVPKRAKQALDEQRMMLESILNSVPQGIFWKDRNSIYLGCNRVFAKAAGLKKPSDIIDQNDFELPWGSKEAKNYVADDRSVMETRTPKMNIIEPITMADGSFRWVTTSKTPLIGNGGEVFGILGVFEDITERRQAQEALQRNEQLFSGVYNSSSDALFLVDWDTRLITDCNAQALRIFEANSKEEVIGQAGHQWHRIPRTEERARQSHETVAAGREWTEEVEYKTLKGKFFWGLFAARKLDLPDSRTALVRITDITSLKRMQQQLRQERDFSRWTMDVLPGVFYVIEADGRIRAWNPQLERVTGRNADQLKGVNCMEVLHPEDHAHTMQAIEAVFRNGEAQAEARLVALDGTEHPHHFHGRRIEMDGRPCILGIGIDTSERKRNEARLLLQESALNAAANGIVITNSEGKIVWSNPAFSALTGYAAEEVSGLTHQVLKSGRQGGDFYQKLWQTISTGEVWRGELINRRKDGTLYDEEMTITPVRGSDGKVINFIAIKQDISQRKQMEAQYLRAQRMEGIGMLAGGIAHDLNNVLAPILMSIQLLQEMHPDDDTREILQSLQDSAQRGADIVRQVLTFARGIKGERLLVAPKHLIKDMGRVAQEAFPRNIRVSTDIPNDLWSVTGDPTQLHQVLLNLSINARDAMPDGGTLQIKAHNETVKNLQSELGMQIADGDYMVVSVKDSGMGIPPELHERIFEPFFTTKEQGKGTGLGLSTVMGIVKSHHGYLRIVSELGKGAEFMVYLPAVKDAVSHVAVIEKTAPPQGHGELILVVDDEPAIVDVARDILVRHGYRVLTASDGTEALTQIAQNHGKVHLVVTDIMMPFMDGVALVRSLRRMAPTIKVIAASGLASGASMVNKVDELRRLGVPPIMHKPFSAEKLLNNISLVLSGETLEPEPSDRSSSSQR